MSTVVGSLDALSTMALNNTTSIIPDHGGARTCAIRSAAPMLPDPDDTMALRLLDMLNTFYMPVVIYLGLVGNLLSLVTFLFTHLKSRTSSLYMGSLAISDAGFLFVLSFAWLQERGVNVNGQGWCQILVFLSSAFSCCSVWLTVGFTAERFVAVRYPMWRFQLGVTKLHPKTAIIATAVCSFAFNAHLLVFVGVRQMQGGFQECGLNPQYEDALYYINILDTVLTLIVPFVLITVMNAMIARAVYLFYARYKRRSAMAIDGEPFKTDNPSRSSLMKRQEICFSADGTTTAVCGGGIPHSAQIGVTRMLLVISTVFILLNLPSYVTRIYVFVLSLAEADSQDSPSSGSLPYILQRYFMLLYYTNFAINFVLYNASSRMFRRTMCKYFCGRWTSVC